MMISTKIFRIYCLWLLAALYLTGCMTQLPANVQFTATSPSDNPTTTPPPPETIILQTSDHEENNTEKLSNALPNLWTKIDKEKISLYPVNWLSDFTYARDGSLWLAGGFGIIHQETNGQQTWYSIKKDLPVNFFSRIAISPTGEVWAGGTDNALFRFDGTQWINEGIKFPAPFDTRKGWLCYSEDIAGMDFDPQGNAWVINGGIEIYTQAHGQWVNFPFPKDILPWAGGGACPEGIRVLSENDITIKRSGCCDSSPVAYHFDGEKWNKSSDFTMVDDLFNARHQTDQQSINIGLIETSGYTDWAFGHEVFMPDYMMGYQERISLMINDDGTIWLTNGVNLYNNASGKFEELADNYAQTDPTIADSTILNFGNETLYYQKGKRPFRLPWVLQDTPIGWYEGYSTVDSQNRIWAYVPDKGLTVIEKGVPHILGSIKNISANDIGGILLLDDGRIVVGSRAAFWVFDNNLWQKMEIPIGNQLLTHLGQNSQGITYAATDTGVYEIQGNTFKLTNFVNQDSKPMIVSENGEFGDCKFNKNYTIAANCPGIGYGTPTLHYSARLLSVQKDDSVIYVNNKIIAKLEDGKWKSFLFDALDIVSAATGKDGSIWLYTGANGLIRFDPDIFESYQALTIP